jgi:hypothetical protein
MEEDEIVISTKQIINEDVPILNVTHELDGVWQFLNHYVAVSEEDAVIVGIHEIVKVDPTLVEIINLPRGSSAHRKNIGSQWIITNDN